MAQSGGCPKCGKTEMGNMYMYGSPFRKCTKCGKEYVDTRFREVAIDGFDPKSESPMFYLKGAGLMAIFLVIALVFLKATSKPNYISFKAIALVGVAGFGFAVTLILAIRNFLGFDQKLNEKALKESEKRLADQEYVKKLVEYGYKIPEKYL